MAETRHGQKKQERPFRWSLQRGSALALVHIPLGDRMHLCHLGSSGEQQSHWEDPFAFFKTSDEKFCSVLLIYSFTFRVVVGYPDAVESGGDKQPDVRVKNMASACKEPRFQSQPCHLHLLV